MFKYFLISFLFDINMNKVEGKKNFVKNSLFVKMLYCDDFYWVI